MSDALYDEQIKELARSRTGAGLLAPPAVSATVSNPLCGDRVTMTASVADGRIVAVGHEVKGCLLCEASAAAVADAAPGQPVEEVTALAGAVRAMLRNDQAPPPAPFGAFAAFAPARRHRARHECVLLPLDALAKALRNR